MRGKANTEFGRGGELNTIVGKGTVIEGDLKVQNSLRVDGEVKGKIESTDTVVIGKDGSVTGRVHAKNVMLAGRVQGNVQATGKVLLESKASVFGDIKAVRLVVDEGAIFNGRCHMKGGDMPRPEPSDDQADQKNDQADQKNDRADQTSS